MYTINWFISVEMDKIIYIFALNKKEASMSKLITVWKYIRQHKYLLTIVIFGVIIVFLDENSLIQRQKHRQEIKTLTNEIEKYRKQFEEDTRKLKELTNNPEAMEKIAREKYLMKRPDEDIFIFEE